jgi:hypothetical protein
VPAWALTIASTVERAVRVRGGDGSHDGGCGGGGEGGHGPDTEPSVVHLKKMKINNGIAYIVQPLLLLAF